MRLTSGSSACYPLYHYTELLSHLIQLPVKNNIDTITIAEMHGSGGIKILGIEDGFYVACYNFSLKEDFVFNWFKNKPGEEQFYKLVFNIGAHIGLTDPTIGVNIENSLNENGTILYSTDFSKDTFIPKQQPVNRIGILFTKNWLENNFHAASDRLFDIVNVLITKNKPTYIAEQMQARQYFIVTELIKEITKDSFALIHVKLKAMMLLNDFLDKIVERDIEDVKANQSAHFAQIVMVENKMKDYFDKAMPNISALARQFNMSPATLKRHFKIVYGKTIYNYYLEKKLTLGKKMLEAQTHTISEIAYTLGYNKINSFSKAFKKYYGVLPRDINHRD